MRGEAGGGKEAASYKQYGITRAAFFSITCVSFYFWHVNKQRKLDKTQETTLICPQKDLEQLDDKFR